MKLSNSGVTALLVGLVLFPLVARAQDFTGKVVGVSDGDTISVMHKGKAEKVRLNGIDCPESKQAFGQRAKQFTSALCLGDEVTVKGFGKDKYGRTIADVVLGDGRVLNQELLKAGFAWWYREYSKDKALAKLEREARAAKRGLWHDTASLAPWEYRRQGVVERALETRVTLQKPYPASYNGAPTDKISVQHAVIEVLKQAGLRYNWKESYKNTNPICRRWATPDIRDKPLREALVEILAPVGLEYDIRRKKLVLVKKAGEDGERVAPGQQTRERRTPKQSRFPRSKNK